MIFFQHLIGRRVTVHPLTHPVERLLHEDTRRCGGGRLRYVLACVIAGEPIQAFGDSFGSLDGRDSTGTGERVHMLASLRGPLPCAALSRFGLPLFLTRECRCGRIESNSTASHAVDGGHYFSSDSTGRLLPALSRPTWQS